MKTMEGIQMDLLKDIQMLKGFPVGRLLGRIANGVDFLMLTIFNPILVVCSNSEQKPCNK